MLHNNFKIYINIRCILHVDLDAYSSTIYTERKQHMSYFTENPELINHLSPWLGQADTKYHTNFITNWLYRASIFRMHIKNNLIAI